MMVATKLWKIDLWTIQGLKLKNILFPIPMFMYPKEESIRNVFKW